MWKKHVKMLRKSYKCDCDIKHGKEDKCSWGQSEIYKPSKNCKFQEAKALAPPDTPEIAISINATVMLNEFCYQNGWTSFYKWEMPTLDEIISQVGPENVLFGVLIRDNVVDWLICEVRDCFPGGLSTGMPVFYNETTNSWEEYDGCFSRREAHIKTKVHFYEDKFDKMIQHLHDVEKEKRSKQKKYESAVTYEELTAFEYTDDEEVFQKSMKAWHLLANRFVTEAGSSVDYDIIESVVGNMRNTRNISYQEEIVENYEPFFQAIRDAGLGKYIRTQTTQP